MGIYSHIRARLSGMYPGWWVLLGVSLLALISGGALMHGAAVFFNPIRRDLNLSSASASLIFTISRAQASLLAPLYGWLVDRLGAKPLIRLGAVAAGLGLIAITFIDNYWAFLAVYALAVAVPSHLGFGHTLSTAANGWFVRRKAIALTLVLTGFAAGGALFVYPMGVGVESLGWRMTSICTGLFVLVAGLALSGLVRNPPESVEGTPEEPDSRGDADGGSRRSSDFSLSEAFRTRAFWILLAASTLRISAESGIAVHIIPIMVWQGAGEEFAAGLYSVFFLLSIPLRLTLGMAGHRLSFQPLIATGMMAAVAGCGLLIASDGVRSLYPFVILFAVYEGSVALQWIAIGNYFGRRNYGAITGIMRASDTVGSFLAPWYAGWIFDRTGSYSFALGTFAAAFTAAGLLYAISRRPKLPADGGG